MNKIKGKTFCFTGKGQHTRNQLHSFVKDSGGIVKNNVSSTLDYLVDSNLNDIMVPKTGKQLDAQYYGVKIITEDKFLKMLASANKTKAKKPKATNAPKQRNNDLVAEYYVCEKVWEAIDQSMYIHNIEPINQECYHTVQLEAARTWRIDELMNELHNAMNSHYELTAKELKDAPLLEEIIDEIYIKHADTVVHEYMENEGEYFKPSEHDPDTCPDCIAAKAIETGIKAKQEASNNEATKDGLPIQAIETEEKSGMFGQLAMFGGMLLGAGLAQAGKTNINHRIDTTNNPEEIDEIAKESVI